MPEELTGLLKRGELLEALDCEFRAAQSMACLMLDIDRMKSLNESLGHILGDRILVEVARRLLSVVGPDALVSRFGGDAFVAASSGWTANTAHELADQVADRILATPIIGIEKAHHLSKDEFEAINQSEFWSCRFFGRFEDGNYALAVLGRSARLGAPNVAPFEGMPINAAYVSVSIGVSFVTGPQATPTLLLEEAEQGMYLEKRRR